MTPKSKNSKLPRGPHAPGPTPDERVRKSTGADLQNGWLGRHGKLTLTDERLVFVPTYLDLLLGAKRRQFPLADVHTVERVPRSPKDLPSAGLRPRMLIHTEECIYSFMVPDMDAWIDAIEKVYVLRERRGAGVGANILRDDVENLMLSED
jgi:hypothetical protein